MLAGPAVGLALPLLPAQILWVNLLTHGLPGVALGGEPADPGIMDRPPRPPAESVLGAGLWQRIVRVGLVVAAVTLGIALWGHATGRPWQSMAFFALGTTQLAVALGSRARPGTLANPMLPAAVAAALALQFAGLYLPFLRELLHTQPLTGPRPGRGLRGRPPSATPRYGSTASCTGTRHLRQNSTSPRSHEHGASCTVHRFGYLGAEGRPGASEPAVPQSVSFQRGLIDRLRVIIHNLIGLDGRLDGFPADAGLYYMMASRLPIRRC